MPGGDLDEIAEALGVKSEQRGLRLCFLLLLLHCPLLQLKVVRLSLELSDLPLRSCLVPLVLCVLLTQRLLKRVALGAQLHDKLFKLRLFFLETLDDELSAVEVRHCLAVFLGEQVHLLLQLLAHGLSLQALLALRPHLELEASNLGRELVFLALQADEMFLEPRVLWHNRRELGAQRLEFRLEPLVLDVKDHAAVPIFSAEVVALRDAGKAALARL